MKVRYWMVMAVALLLSGCVTGVLTSLGTSNWKEEVELHDGSKIVVNRHAAAQEVWVAARAGGFHFRWDGEAWRDTKDGRELMAVLSDLASTQAGCRVDLGVNRP